jgi:hypothetical protein
MVAGFLGGPSCRTDPAMKLVVEEPEIVPQPDYVFRVDGKLDPAGCANLGSS